MRAGDGGDAGRLGTPDAGSPVGGLADMSLRELLDAGVDVQVAALELLTDAVTARTPAADAGRHGASVLAGLSARVRRNFQRWETQRLGWLCAVEADGCWALETLRTFPHWVAWSHDCSITTARRELRLAHALRDHLPATAERARAGTVGSDHVRALAEVGTTSPARCRALADVVVESADAGDREIGDLTGASGDQEEGADGRSDRGLPRTGEEQLLDLARAYPAGTFRRFVRHFAALADPEADERGFADAVEREYVDLSETLGGYHLAGFLTPEHGQVVSTALRAVMGVPAAGDPRSAGRRRAQGLVDACRLVLDRGLAGGGSSVRPHLSVHVSWTELQDLLVRTGADRDPVTGQGVDWATRLATPPSRWEDGTGPVPGPVLKRLACDGEVTRIVFGPDSQVLDVGRRERTFTGQRRRAIIARDGGCTWPGCEAPPQLCEVHHAVRHWADGGETSTENGALLCWYHHDHVDSHDVSMAWSGGGWQFRRRDGTPVPEHPR